MTPSHRQLITNLIAFTAAAPSIVRATSLMPVKAIPKAVTLTDYKKLLDACYKVTKEQMAANLYGSVFFKIENTHPLLVTTISPFEVWTFKESAVEVSIEQFPYQSVPPNPRLKRVKQRNVPK